MIARCQPDRVLAELSRGDRRSVVGRRLRCELQRGRELAVGAVRRERQMTGARDRIVGEPGEAAVDALPLADGEPLVQHRREQRVREADRAARQLDHVAERGVESGRLDTGS